jgi:post-segregation antitoxin (ccd killing protein)
LEALMTYVPHGPKKPVQLMLSEDLVRDAEALLGDVSDIVEKSLSRAVAQEKWRRDPDAQRRVDEYIALANEFYEKHGIWGEEFSIL